MSAGPVPSGGLGAFLLAAQLALAASTVLVSPAAQTDPRPDIPTLLVALETPGAQGWNRTVGQLAAHGVDAVPALIEALSHPHRAVREGAAHALGDIGPPAAPAVAALMRTFEDDDDFVRWKSARALGNIGPSARAAVPLLRRAVTPKETEVVRAHAMRAIERITNPR